MLNLIKRPFNVKEDSACCLLTLKSLSGWPIQLSGEAAGPLSVLARSSDRRLPSNRKGAKELGASKILLGEDSTSRYRDCPPADMLANVKLASEGRSDKTSTLAVTEPSTTESSLTYSTRLPKNHTLNFSRNTTSKGTASLTCSSTGTCTTSTTNNTCIAVVVGRGLACEVGMAVMDLHSPELILLQFSDNQTFVKTLTTLEFYEPSDLLMPSTACDATKISSIYRIEYLQTINSRLDCVSEFIEKKPLLFGVQKVLEKFVDLDRLLSSLIQVPRVEDLNVAESLITNILALKHVLELVRPLRESLEPATSSLLHAYWESLDDYRFQDIKNLIGEVVNDDSQYTQGFVNMRAQKCFAIRKGKNGLLDVARQTYTESLQDVQDLASEYEKKYELPFKVSFAKSKGFYLFLIILILVKRIIDIIILITFLVL
ncbi:mutS protein homolog 4-like [Zophobas morio]|uniref:mutS protein homolog 4-like n=1 Tax=Zophobas morio TaxID=2755281 RepID=UPI00308287F0